MRKIIYIILFFLWAIPSGFAQLKSNTFEEAEELSRLNPKPIVVFTHTNWCNYCKIMENATFKDTKIVAVLNKHFYFIAFDAETKRDIFFNAQTFRFQPTGTNTGIHELATALATIDSQVVYPTVTILESGNTIVLQQPSFLSAKDLLLILDKLK